MPFFSIIIPLFNKETFVEATLKSVLKQHFSDFEVLIINDGSTDKSEEKVLSFNDDRIRYFSLENQGVSSTRNFGIANASANYISFLDADDYWYPEFLGTMVNLIENYQMESVFSAAIEKETATKTFPAVYSVLKTDGPQVVDYFKASLRETIICTSCAVFHKDVFKKAGNFDVLMKSGEDTDLWIRIGQHYKVVFTSRILAKYLYDSASLSNRTNHNSALSIFEKYRKEEKSNSDIKKFLDLNRFSIGIQLKSAGEFKIAEKILQEINLANLTFLKKVVRYLPAFILNKLLRFRLSVKVISSAK